MFFCSIMEHINKLNNKITNYNGEKMKKIHSYQLDYRYENTKRIKFLREKALDAKPFVCVERARYFTESYKNHEEENIYVKKALALKNLLEKMTLYISDEELIIGNNSSGPRGSVVAPEYSANWLSKELEDDLRAPDKRPQDKHLITDEVKQELINSILPFWLDKTVESNVEKSIPNEILKKNIASYNKEGISTIAPEIYLRNGIGHVIVDYEKLLKSGFRGILDEAKIQYDGSKSLEGPDSGNDFYKSVIMTYEAVIDWILRYTSLTKEEFKKGHSQKRKQELENIYKDLIYISNYPPATFRQALQTWFFGQLILFGLEQNCTAVSPGRFDQYIYPFYKKDIEEGIISRKEAIELIQCLFIKLSEMSILWDYDSASYWSGFSTTLCLTVGGCDENGNDVTNDLSYAILEADKNTGLLQPETALRVGKNTSKKLLIEALKIVKLGRGKPKFFMDNSAIAMLMNNGVTLEESRNYSVVGCVELTPTGNTTAYTGASFINLAKVLELALNQGNCLLTGKLIGTRSIKVNNYDELIDNFREQLIFSLNNTVSIMNAILESHSQLYPCPFTSSLIDDCLGKGLDFTEGGAKYKYIGVSGVGLPDVANSIAAIDRFVFKDKIISMEDLIDNLKNDFENNEKLRLELLDNCPKYGNDDDYVDSIARYIGQFFCREVSKKRGPHESWYRPGLFAVSINVPFGLVTGAAADGRKAKSPLADGGISPVAGTERESLLGVIKSASKIDNVLAGNGTLLNLKLNPAIFENEENIAKLAGVLRSYNDLGGYHIQFNVVDDYILKEAKKHPEKFRGLMVRVAGYSAYFIELNPEVQDDIIARTTNSDL